jgi:PAS domain S-box-containing protein
MTQSSGKVQEVASTALTELGRRPSRPADLLADALAIEPILAALAARDPRVLQQVAETALSHCGAQTAGLSTPESNDDQRLLRWSAVAGGWAHCRDRINTIQGSPTGIVLDQNAPIHVLMPEQRFAPGAELLPPAAELLMVPFHIGRTPIGTLWVIRHDLERQFDTEDLRRLTILAPLAALTWLAQAPPTLAPGSSVGRSREREGMELALIAGKMATWHWNPVTDEVSAAEAMAALFGLRAGERWISSDQGRAIIHPDDRDRQLAMVSAALESGGGWHSEFRIIRPVDGKVAWLEERAHRVPDPITGGYVMTGVVRDITERKQAEQAQRESEGRLQEVRGQLDQMRRLYESILTNTPDLAYVWNLEHRFIYANEGLLRMWGKTWDEAIGRTCLELGYEPWHAAMHDQEINQVVATGKPVRGQVPFNGTFGRRVYDYILVPVFNDRGDVEAVAGTTRDVTDSAVVEDRLRYHAQTVETLLNAAPLGVFLLDHEFRVVSYNDIARAAFNTSDEPAGRDFEQLMRQLWEEPYSNEVMALYQHTLETGEPFYTAERGEVRADRGITEYYEWRIERIVLPDGKFGIVCYFRDISAQVQARLLIEQSRQALRETDRRKDQFLAVLAHELRNPLAPIRHGVKRLQHNPGDATAVTAAADMMDRQVNQLVRLVDDLLDVSRISTGRVELHMDDVELAGVIHQAVETIRPVCDDMAHLIEIAFPEDTIWVRGDRARLMQAFANLLSNACRYMEKGGRIWITVRQLDGDVEIRFRDTGIGIAEDQLQNIFGMYTQVESSLEHSKGGLGIGLTLAQSLLELHDGRIEARSEGIGHGSEFVVTLPMAPAPAPASPSRRDAEPPSRPQAGQRRILVVDDNRDSAESLAQLLVLLGHDARPTYDGMLALELAESFRPDVVLLDLGMPRLNGYDACRAIRSAPWGKEVLVIAQSGWAQQGDKERSQEAGFDAHLVKPINHDELLRLLARGR